MEYLVALEPHVPINMFALLLFLNPTWRRVSEAINFRTSDVDLNAAIASIEKTKNGDSAEASLVPMLVDILRDLPSRHGRVFGYTDRSFIYEPPKRACSNAGVKYLATHQPGHHSFATSLGNQQWTSKAIADAGGWKSPRLVDETYIHTNEPAKKAAELIGKKLAKNMGRDFVKERFSRFLSGSKRGNRFFAFIQNGLYIDWIDPIFCCCGLFTKTRV